MKCPLCDERVPEKGGLMWSHFRGHVGRGAYGVLANQEYPQCPWCQETLPGEGEKYFISRAWLHFHQSPQCVAAILMDALSTGGAR